MNFENGLDNSVKSNVMLVFSLFVEVIMDRVTSLYIATVEYVITKPTPSRREVSYITSYDKEPISDPVNCLCTFKKKETVYYVCRVWYTTNSNMIITDTSITSCLH